MSGIIANDTIRQAEFLTRLQSIDFPNPSFDQLSQTEDPDSVFLPQNKQSETNFDREHRLRTLDHRAPHELHDPIADHLHRKNPNLGARNPIHGEEIRRAGEPDRDAMGTVDQDPRPIVRRNPLLIANNPNPSETLAFDHREKPKADSRATTVGTSNDEERQRIGALDRDETRGRGRRWNHSPMMREKRRRERSERVVERERGVGVH